MENHYAIVLTCFVESHYTKVFSDWGFKKHLDEVTKEHSLDDLSTLDDLLIYAQVYEGTVKEVGREFDDAFDDLFSVAKKEKMTGVSINGGLWNVTDDTDVGNFADYTFDRDGVWTKLNNRMLKKLGVI